MSVDAVLLRIAKDAGQERVTDFVVLSRLCDLLGYGMFMLRQEVFSKGRQSRLGPSVGYLQLVKHFCNGRRSPEFYTNTCFLLNPGQDLLHFFEEILFESLRLIKVYPDAAPSHFYA